MSALHGLTPHFVASTNSPSYLAYLLQTFRGRFFVHQSMWSRSNRRHSRHIKHYLEYPFLRLLLLNLLTSMRVMTQRILCTSDRKRRGRSRRKIWRAKLSKRKMNMNIETVKHREIWQWTIYPKHSALISLEVFLTKLS